MAADSRNASRTSLDDQIAYHKEMEQMVVRAGDFTKAEHHRNMQAIFVAMKGKQPYKTAEEISDDDFKIH